MLDFILSFDYQITNFINGIIPHNILFNTVFLFFSQKGNSIFIWLMIIVLLIIFEEKHDKRFIYYFFISFGIAAFLSNIILKNIFVRLRPSIYSSIYNCPKDFSFPSGHATTAFTAAVILSAFDKKRKWWYYGVASLIALSRLYLYCHYFIDIFAGTIIGFFIGQLCLFFLRKLFILKKNHSSL